MRFPSGSPCLPPGAEGAHRTLRGGPDAPGPGGEVAAAGPTSDGTTRARLIVALKEWVFCYPFSDDIYVSIYIYIHVYIYIYI